MAKLLLFGWLILLPASAMAQMAVSDPPVEGHTGVMVGQLAVNNAQLETANGTLASILQQDTLTATSLTLAGGSGRFQPQAQYLDSLMETLSGGNAVTSSASFIALFPGWLDFGPNAADLAAQITTDTLSTYANAITVAQSQSSDFSAEDTQLTTLEACNSAAVSVLQAIQCNSEIQLAAAQQTQMLRQLELTHLIVDAVHDGEELNERAQLGANYQTATITAGQGAMQ